METLTVNEIFFSIQGEGDRMGWPCIFIRLSFCNLRCSWCDSTYTFYEGASMTQQDVMDTISEYPCKLVEVTGGEPLMQKGCLPLLTRLCDDGYEVMLETSGSLDVTPVDPRVKRIMDLKPPGSGMVARNRMANLDVLNERDEVKMVLRDRHDYEWAKQQIEAHAITARCPVLLSPVFGDLEPRDLAEWILDDGLPVRMQLQLHKFIWDPKMRGV